MPVGSPLSTGGRHIPSHGDDVMRPITYALQFRGQADDLEGGGLRKQARAPGCALVTSLTPEGVAGSFVWAPGVEEAYLESTLALADDDTFEGHGTIVFSRGHVLNVLGRGQFMPSPDPHLRHGTVVWEVAGGEGQFDGASGRITSNFFLSDTGEITDNQLGVIFPNGRGGLEPLGSTAARCLADDRPRQP